MSNNKVLVLRTNKADNTSCNNFKWPFEGDVECAEFEPTAKCGHGFHGLLWGQGDGGMLNWDADATWCVVEVESKDIINLDGKVKFPRGRVVMTGSRRDATCYVYNNAPQGTVVHGLILEGGRNCYIVGGHNCHIVGGDCAVLTGGYNSTLTGGYNSTLTGGAYVTLTGGDDATLTGGDNSTLKGGDGSTLTGGYHSNLTGGAYATLTGGNYSTLTGGNYSTLTGGYKSTLTGGADATLKGGAGSVLTGGADATLKGGAGSVLTGGDKSTLSWKIFDSKSQRYRIYVHYVGEGGCKPDVAYKCTLKGKLVEA
jgi:hypothetical protein